MKISFLLIFLFVGGMSLVSQEQKTTFIGKIIDSETKVPIPLVTIRSASVYTITNTDGEFEIPVKQPDEEISFTHMSYHGQQIESGKIPAIIELKPEIIELPEVVIIPRETLVKELKVVWNKYMLLTKDKKNKDFPESTFYYRQLTSVNNLYTEYIECFFTAPTTVCVLGMSLQEGRFARIKKDSLPHFTNYFYNSQVAPFDRKNARFKNAMNAFLCADFEKHYEIYLDQTISPGQENEIKVYEFVPGTPVGKDNTFFPAGKLYVRTRDHAFIRAEIELPSLGVTFDHKSEVLSEDHTFIIFYREGITSYPIVESVQASTTLRVLRDQKESTMHIQSLLFANDFTFDKKGNKIKQKDHLLEKVARSKYNQAFWDNNPVVKRTKVEQQVLDDFNRLGYFGTMNMAE